MIGYIKGTVEGIMSDSIMLENNGIGYRVFTSGQVIEKLAGLHEPLTLFTYMHVREDGIALFGFPSQEELDVFRLLLGVNGIGPKAALAVLSVLSVRDLTLAVMSGDTKAITKANGIGAKGANRIIMELKDKLTVGDEYGQQAPDAAPLGETQAGGSVQDAILALVSLGYSEHEARKAIGRIPDAGQMEADAILKHALKMM